MKAIGEVLDYDGLEFWPMRDDPRAVQWADCESPIEQLLCRGLFAVLGCKAVLGKYNINRRAELAKLCDGIPSVFLFTQQPVGRYRVDFLLVMINPVARRSLSFIIEADGERYHSAERDRPRDTELIQHGAAFVIRFTGSDIHTRLEATVGRVADVLRYSGIRTAPVPGLPEYGSLWFAKSGVEHRHERQQERDDIVRREREEWEVARYYEQERTGMWDSDW